MNVALVNDNGLKRFRFTPQIPGLKADWQTKDWESLSRNVEATECDEVRLRTELEKLPRAVTDKAGKKEGDPLNLVVIANPDDLETFIWSGWDETERITGGSAWRTFKSFLVGTKYRYSPIRLTLRVWPPARGRAAEGARVRPFAKSLAVVADAISVSRQECLDWPDQPRHRSLFHRQTAELHHPCDRC